MPTLEWLKEEFHYGYSSGDLSTQKEDKVRTKEENRIGGSYKNIVAELLKKFIKPNYNVLELGPGKGSWSNAILEILNQNGSLTTIDFQDVSQWIYSKKYTASIKHHQVNSIDYSFLPDKNFDIFWSFGVLCHNNINNVYQILLEAYPKMKKGSLLIHQYSDWEKLEVYGWENGCIPLDFKTKKDNEIWWTRNNQKTMQTILESIGYEVLNIDVDLVKRDSIFIAKKM